jgi:two-component system sporulation sensor kinase A
LEAKSLSDNENKTNCIKEKLELLQPIDALNSAKKLALGMIAEVNNPLIAMKGFFELLRYVQKHDVHKTKGYMDALLFEINRVELSFEKLRIFAEIQQPQFQQCNLTLLLQQSISYLEKQVKHKEISIKLVYEYDILPIYCDENQVKQLLIQLLTNSIEAIPTGGTIRIEVNVDPKEKVHIRFIDIGSILTEEQLCKLGEPFFTTKKNRMGIGLMICRDIITNHKGSLHFSRNENHQETTVEVEFPIFFNNHE